MLQQLIIDGIYLPEVKTGKYRAYEAPLTQELEMISGKMVKEYRGVVWIIEYEADYLTNAELRPLLNVLRGASSFNVTFLPDNASGMESGTFITTGITDPAFRFDRYGEAYWDGLSFTLREVAPHA